MYKITIRHDSEDGYFLLFYIDKQPISSDQDIIRYFNLSEDFWYSNLLKFNASKYYYGLYFNKYKDAIKARKWIEDNLDYFLMLRKLGGSKYDL